MREINCTEDTLTLCKALSSPIRLRIVRLVSRCNGINLNDLAEKLDVTNSALTAHIRALMDAGVLRVENVSGKRGLQKRCYLEEYSFMLNILNEPQQTNTIECEIPIGSYVSHQAMPTCALVTQQHIIGKWDEPCYFDDPERIYASLLWMGSGFLEYRVPNYLSPGQRVNQIRITQELSSEAPGYNEDWPSDICFEINNTPLGFWVCPGDFGAKRGLFTPDWWISGLNQHGLLKALIITHDGTYIDAQRISNVTITDLCIDPGSEIVYRISAPSNAVHAGGLSIYGRGFGNYNQGIIVQMMCE